MVEKRTYAEIALIILFMASLGVNITQEDAANNIYTCNGEQDMYCFKLSKVNADGIQRNCYYNEDSSRSYKVCSTGWNKITLDEALEPKIIYTEKGISASQWLCSPSGCEPIN